MGFSHRHSYSQSIASLSGSLWWPSRYMVDKWPYKANTLCTPKQNTKCDRLVASATMLCEVTWLRNCGPHECNRYCEGPYQAAGNVAWSLYYQSLWSYPCWWCHRLKRSDTTLTRLKIEFGTTYWENTAANVWLISFADKYHAVMSAVGRVQFRKWKKASESSSCTSCRESLTYTWWAWWRPFQSSNSAVWF